MNEFRLYGYILLGITILVFSVFSAFYKVVFKRLRLPVFILVLSMFLWFLLDVVLSNLNIEYLLFVSKIKYSFILLIPSSFVALSYSMYLKKLSKRVLYYIPSFLFILLMFFSDIVIDVATPMGYRVSYQGDLYWLMNCYIFVLPAICLFFISKNINNRTIVTKTHNRIYYYSSYIMLLVLSASYIIVPYMFYSFILDPFAKACLAIYSILLIYLYSNRQPIDPLLLSKRLITYIILTLVVFFVIAFNLIVIPEYISDTYEIPDQVYLFVSAAIIILLYSPFKKLITRILDKLIKVRGYDYYDALDKVMSKIKDYKGIEKLGNFIVSKLRLTMKLKFVSLYLLNDSGDMIKRFSRGRSNVIPQIPIDHALIEKLLSTEYIVTEDEKHLHEQNKSSNELRSPLLKFLDRNEIELAFPLFIGEKLIGLILLGEKQSSESFTFEDIGFFNALANYLSVFIDNSRLFSNAQKTAEQLEKLNNLISDISYSMSPKELFEIILEDMNKNIEASSSFFFLYNYIEKTLLLISSVNARFVTESVSYPVSEKVIEGIDKKGVLNLVASENNAILPDWLNEMLLKNGVSDHLLIPINGQKKLLGILVVENRYKKNYSINLDMSLVRLYASFLSNLITNFTYYYNMVEAKDYSQGILDNIESMVITIDVISGHVISINDAGEDFFGGIIGQSFYDVLKHNSQIAEIIKEVVSSEKDISGREVNIKRNEIYSYIVSTRFINNKEHLLIVMNDVTEVNRLRNEILQKERQVTIASMASVIVHEIRNPLTSVSALVKLMPEQNEDPEYIDMFNELVPGELDRINVLMEDLLEFSRAKKLYKSDVDIYELVKKRVNMLQLKAQEAGVTISFDGKSSIISIDENRVIQVLQNIMQNGIQAMDTHGMLRVIVAEGDYDNGDSIKEMVKVSIIDNGKGMDDETKNSLFKPFYTTKETGTGLGLAVTKKIIQDHGGFIKVNSTLGVGSRFDIYLPKE